MPKDSVKIRSPGSPAAARASASPGALSWQGRRARRHLGPQRRDAEEGGEGTQGAGSGESIALDVADQQAVARAADEIVKRHGRIDILVNSAGINHPKRSFRNVSIDGWDQIVAINLSGMFYCCTRCCPACASARTA